jgi:hypothetical protein
VERARVGESHPDAVRSPILGLELTEKLKPTGVDVYFRSGLKREVNLAPRVPFSSRS